MKKIFLLFPILALLLHSCNNTYSFQSIEILYDNPENGIIKADGGPITVYVESTHSFQFTSQSPDVSFFRDGIVDYQQDGIAIVLRKYEISVQPNNTGKERLILISAHHQNNPEFTSTIVFKQLAKEEEESGEETGEGSTEGTDEGSTEGTGEGSTEGTGEGSTEGTNEENK
jgi:hypothetical protein